MASRAIPPNDAWQDTSRKVGVAPVHTFSGKRLRELRKTAGFSGERLAVDVGRSLYSISGYEAGRSVPSAEVLGRLADALGCDPGDFYEVVERVAA